jgi:anti-sigma-K factor RskA
MSDNTSRSRAFWAGWIAAGLFLVVAATAGVYAANLRNQLEDIELRLVDAVNQLQVSQQRLGDASTELAAMHSSLGLLSAPDVQTLKLTGKGHAPEASGRVFLSRTKGVLFSAAKLPPLAEGSAYQLWMLTRAAPVSAGQVRPAQDGSVTAAFDPLSDTPDVTGFAVSVEPEDGSPKPTSDFLLVAP